MRNSQWYDDHGYIDRTEGYFNFDDRLDNYADRVINKVQINNITNITNVNVYGHGHGGYGYGRKNRRRWRKNRRHGRKRPELLTFCQSCGFLDQDKVMRMSDDQLIDGTVDVMRYAADDLKKNVRGIGHDIARMGRGSLELCKCTCDVVKGVVGIFTDIFD